MILVACILSSGCIERVNAVQSRVTVQTKFINDGPSYDKFNILTDDGISLRVKDTSLYERLLPGNTYIVNIGLLGYSGSIGIVGVTEIVREVP